MSRILLVVTGDLEEAALADALRRVFPSAHFGVRKTQGFTSNRLPRPAPGSLRSKAENIVTKLLGAAVPREPGSLPYDYAVAVEDVELSNEPDDSEVMIRAPDEGIACILDHLKVGIESILRQQSEEQRTVVLPKGKARRSPSIATDDDRRRFLRERCSFHLLRPMAEALFFGDKRAIERARGPGRTHPEPRFDPSTCDIERFETDDSAYLGAPDDPRIPWATANRHRHPKHYLQYLLDPTGTVRKPYKETEHGKRALAELDWQAVVAPSSHARMARALLADIADMLGEPLPWCGAGALHPLTRHRGGGPLRNVS